MNFPCVYEGYPLTAHDHAMLVVGWTPTHLIIKNSYGNYDDFESYWGEEVILATLASYLLVFFFESLSV